MRAWVFLAFYSLFRKGGPGDVVVGCGAGERGKSKGCEVSREMSCSCSADEMFRSMTYRLIGEWAITAISRDAVALRSLSC